MKRRKIALVLVVAMILQLAPLPQGMLVGWLQMSTTSQAAAMSGQDGNISWALTQEEHKEGWLLGSSDTAYKLTLSGTGKMSAYQTESYTLNGKKESRTTAPWKEYAANIQTVEIQSGVTNVSRYAFWGCSAITTVQLPADIQEIGEYAFANCSNLKSINLPEGITTIKERAFYTCTCLTGVQLPKTVETIGLEAFSKCSALEEITIPASVTKMGMFAVSNCKNLQKIVVEEGVKEIGGYAFYGNESLTQLTLPVASLQTIGMGAFSSTALEELVIPASVTMIYGNPCVNKQLKQIQVVSGNQNYTVRDNILIELKNGAFYKTLCYPAALSGKVSIPSPVQEIGEKSFYATQLTDVALPASLLTIGENAFTSGKLTAIDIPGNVKTIGAEAFEECYSLKDVTFGGDVETIDYYAFEKCRSITELALPDKIKKIGSSAFLGCTGLREVVLPNSLENIGNAVFADCSNLKKIEIGQQLKEMSGSVLNGCPKMSQITISERNPYMLAEDNIIYNKKKTTLIYYAASREGDKFVVPDTIDTIGDNAFTYTSKLEELRIPASVTSLGWYAIYHNSQLGKILFYGNAPEASYRSSQVKTQDNIVYYSVVNASIIQNRAATGGYQYNNSGLVIFKTVDSTGWDKGWTEKPEKEDITDKTNAKYEWTYKYQIADWDPDKTDVVEGTFGSLSWTYRDDIGEISFSGSGKTDDYTADALPTWSNAENVDHMQDIQLVDTTKASDVQIGNYAFYGAKKLIRINSAEELVSIGESAFSNCTKLRVLYVQDTPKLGTAAFAGDIGLADDADVRGAQSIGDSAFENCSNMTGVLLGDGLQTLGVKSFYGCSALEGVMLPENITALPEQCFGNCTKLRTLNIPKSITTIGKNCLNGCTKFEKIYFYGDYPATWEDDSLTSCAAGLTIYYRAGNQTWEKNVPDGIWNGIPVKALSKFYTNQKDDYSFANTDTSFGYSSKYFIPRQRYITAVQSVIRGSYYYAWDSAWRGSCFGMAASTLEFYQGDKFKAGDYTAGASSLYEVKAPRNSEADLTKLIEIYQVSQFADKVSDEIGGNYGQYKALVRQVEEFERSGGLKVDLQADPIVLCVYSNYSGHAVVPISVDVDGSGDYIMQVYDCNAPGTLQTLKVNKNFSGIEYNFGWMSYTKASFVKYSTIRDELQNADFTGSSLKAEKAEESTKVSIATNSEDVSLENSGGKDFSEIKGAYEQRPMSDDGQDVFSGVRSFVLPQGEYKVKRDTTAQSAASGENLKYYVATEDMYSTVDTTDQNAQLTVKSVKGKGYDTVTLESSDTATKSQVTVMNTEGGQSTISATGSRLAAEVTENNTIELTVSEDTTEVKVNDEAVKVTNGKVTDIPFKTTQGEEKSYQVTVTAGEGIREVTGAGKYHEGDTYTITAVVEKGYKWKGWSDGNTSQTRTITMGNSDVTYIAMAEKDSSGNGGGNGGGSTVIIVPTATPTTSPSPSPSITPTVKPTVAPTVEPTIAPTAEPTAVPSVEPTKTPAAKPTIAPSDNTDDTTDASEVTTSKKIKKGTVVTVGSAKYIVTKASGSKRTVAFYHLKNKNAKKLTIPKQIKIRRKLYKVTAIERNACKNAKKLKEVVIGANITDIKDSAFRNCSKLEFLSLGKNVKKLGKEAFAGCKNLTAVLVKSDKIVAVGKNAFKGVTSKVTVKSSTKKWSDYAKLFILKGKMSGSALFIIDPVMLKYNGKNY